MSAMKERILFIINPISGVGKKNWNSSECSSSKNDIVLVVHTYINTALQVKPLSSIYGSRMHDYKSKII